jgi:hypothetical protein
MGSGHILVYAFDVFMQIYLSEGYTEYDAAKLILEKNIYGLDIDERACQLAYFALMMKARSYNRRFFRQENIPQPQVYSPAIDSELLEYGSLVKIIALDPKPERPAGQLELFDQSCGAKLNDWNFLCLLSQRYDVVVTNPPYLGSGRFSPKLLKYVNTNYPEVKSDLSMVMYKHALQDLSKKDGYVAFITTSSWMFLSSFEKLRKYVLNNYDFDSLVDFGSELFDGKVGHNLIVAWVNRNCRTHNKMTAIRLVDYCYGRRGEKETEFFNSANRYTATTDNFAKIPGSPVAYWVSDSFYKIFQYPLFTEYSISDGQNKTGNNDKYLREFWEIDNNAVGINKKWLFYAKGGSYRKWFGNLFEVVDWSETARQHYHKDHIARIIPEYLWYEIGITWSLLTSNVPSFRLLPIDATFDVVGSSIFLKDPAQVNFFLGLLNSKVFLHIVLVVNPTLAFQVRDIRTAPIIMEKYELVTSIVENNLSISRVDWDSFETSWDFKRHPLV